jgi:DNA-binding response OmpR family regulator
MMKFDAMERAIAEALGRLDRSPKESALAEADIDTIEQVVEDLPALAWGDGQARSSRVEAAAKAAAPRQYDVLVVGSSLIAEALLETADATAVEHAEPGQARKDSAVSFACESTPDVQAAYDLVRTTEPDLVLIDADLNAAAELVEALMDDPLTETVPIVVVGSFLEQSEAARYVAIGVAKTIKKPTSREALRAVCEETLSPDRGSLTAHAVLGEPTLEELGDRLAAELRDAIVSRADASARSRRIPLGQGTEVLGAVWGAIARVREVVTARTDGTIRFGGGPEGALTPALLLSEPDVARSDRALHKRGGGAEVRLSGRRVVVADDDPGVVWFLADLLKTVGFIVHEAFDGQQALELAYKTSPDLVISDILMPNLDGFSLCRALRRDVALRDTPVILLSWKEDLLQRVRELGAGAAGYVRKESDTRAIIARVREALRVRGRIEARLREEGEVRGRLDGLSIRTLLDVVCATRPEARVSVRDAAFLYEVEIRWGAPHRTTRTDGAGSFLKGSAVLAQLLGVSAGRFTVTTSTSPVDAELDGNLAAQLAKPIARARAAMSLLTGAKMHAVARVHLDDEALADYLKATPERARLLARRLANGAPPRELILCGGCEPALLDDLLCDLAGRGLVVGVDGADGEDMLLKAVTDLLQHTDARASFAPRAGTPSPVAPLIVVEPDACANDRAAPMCTSPAPGAASSLEDAVLREVIHRSPEPMATRPALPDAAPSLIDPQSLRPRTSPPPPACEEVYGTPPADQIIALGEPTIIDDAIVYGECTPSSAALHGAASSAGDGMAASSSGAPLPSATAEQDDLTPFASVTVDTEDAPPPSRRKKWPMVAFAAATGIVAWAILHFSTNPIGLPRQQQRQAPAPELPLPPPVKPLVQDEADRLYYTPLPAETAAPAGTRATDVSTPPDAAQAESTGRTATRGAASAPVSSDSHGARRAPSSRETRGEAQERGCIIDVHASRVAHVRF